MDGIGIMITVAVSRLGRPNIDNGIIMAVACTVVASIRVTTAYRNNPMDGTIMITGTGPKWITVAAVAATVAAVVTVAVVTVVAATVGTRITTIMVATGVATVVPVVMVAVITAAEEGVAAMVAVAATAGAT